MNIKIVEDKITLTELKEIGQEFYTDMVKGAVDIEKGMVAFGGEYHIDAATCLHDAGSKQENVWGFNVVFSKPREEWLEYKALINIKPLQDNRKMEILDEAVRVKVKEVVDAKIE